MKNESVTVVKSYVRMRNESVNVVKSYAIMRIANVTVDQFLNRTGR